MNYDAATVARKIGKTTNWLQRHAHELPHSRAGRTYFWTDQDVADLFEHLRVRPAGAPSDGPGGLRPITGTRRRAS